MTLANFMGDARYSAFTSQAACVKTPCLLVDLAVVAERYEALHNAFPEAKIYYAVKANPAPEVLSLLHSHGSHFDIASRYELDRVLGLQVDPSAVSYGNTIKKAADIAYFYERGVRLFATDSDSDLHTIASNAPGAKVYVRVLVDGGDSADWPLSRKFGCEPEMAIRLLRKAKTLGLESVGVSFHVGSQQRDTEAWPKALAVVSGVFAALSEAGIELQLINLGGGFPGRYLSATPALEHYATSIRQALAKYFPDARPQLIFEPGRSLLADAGVLVSEVVLVSRKSLQASSTRWVYLDVGKFGGLIETLDEAIRYPLFSDRDGEVEPTILAGPTCDSMDILYEKRPVDLPVAIEAGDRVYIASTGAYTTSYSSVEFNGFPPLEAVYYDSRLAASYMLPESRAVA